MYFDMILDILNIKKEHRINNQGINLCYCRFSMIYALAWELLDDIIDPTYAPGFTNCVTTCVLHM